MVSDDLIMRVSLQAQRSRTRLSLGDVPQRLLPGMCCHGRPPHCSVAVAGDTSFLSLLVECHPSAGKQPPPPCVVTTLPVASLSHA